MELQDAKQVLSQSIDIALKSGCFNLNDTIKIIEALQKINSLSDIETKSITPVFNNEKK